MIRPAAVILLAFVCCALTHGSAGDAFLLFCESTAVFSPTSTSCLPPGSSLTTISVKGLETDPAVLRLSSYSWGATNTFSIADSGAGSGAGKVSLSALSATVSGNVPPTLLVAVAKGTVLPRAYVVETIRAEDGVIKVRSALSLGTIAVTGLDQNYGGTVESKWSLQLTYGTILLFTNLQKADGSLAYRPAGWDAIRNVQL
mmetsp:Transcript_18684/g.40171  ORF Transcript_18684/g.40171 Transcript_18684/m.40171 type:complete len:201 (+) Transcript_18684:185-787(+)|eukprot:CAMPEP_0202904962 /NCGR_PEP_ID=MMETSP1392-20130828/31940_1 /ASSEMBLY_ACC=CAM_ASM_000868 /TAXON_ID=225041 /ORGANISM="Chlamydomonas chlamydogama, Strain SAG 11-48b" /LENGTH=200 /DNA_ID=CAMNT_0049592857 /DNA_START=177 /DNA_END=779 /DNA_ORIENTATION=+